MSVPRDSPIRDGSYVTSTTTSVPAFEPGAAATVLSTWKSWLSTWKYNQTRNQSANLTRLWSINTEIPKHNLMGFSVKDDRMSLVLVDPAEFSVKDRMSKALVDSGIYQILLHQNPIS